MTTATVSCWFQDFVLTDEHAACSYGQPVLVDATGSVYGPQDIVVWRDESGQELASSPAIAIAQNLRPIAPFFGDDPAPDVEALLRKFEQLAEASGHAS